MNLGDEREMIEVVPIERGSDDGIDLPAAEEAGAQQLAQHQQARSVGVGAGRAGHAE